MNVPIIIIQHVYYIFQSILKIQQIISLMASVFAGVHAPSMLAVLLTCVLVTAPAVRCIHLLHMWCTEVFFTQLSVCLLWP